MNFASDNVYGVHPAIMESLARANAGTAPSYAGDDLTAAAEARLSAVFERQVRAFMVTTGTAANGLALSALTPGFGAILCSTAAHIYYDECNAPEFFTGGAKIMGLAAPAGKIAAPQIEAVLKGFNRGAHDPRPRGLSITNTSELGTIYKPAEIQAFSKLIAPRGLKLHMDGARFANAVAGLKVAPADLTWRVGVDVMSFGCTKNGAMMLEAVVFFDPALAEDFIHRRMRAGQLVSKSRYLGAQMLAYLEDDLWLRSAATANRLAGVLASGLATFAPRIRIPVPVEANAVFAIMPRSLSEGLLASGAKFHPWMTDSLDQGPGEDEVFVRLMLSFATPEEDVMKFLDLVARLAG